MENSGKSGKSITVEGLFKRIPAVLPSSLEPVFDIRLPEANQTAVAPRIVEPMDLYIYRFAMLGRHPAQYAIHPFF